MRNSRKIISLTVAACMALSVFSFAPAVWADTEAPAAGEETLEQQSAAARTEGDASASEPTEQSGTEQSGEEQTSYTITTSAEPEKGGTVKAGTASAAEGEAVSYTVTPASGYKIHSITIGEQEIKIEDPYEAVSGIFTAEGDTAVAAEFETLKNYKITTSVNSSSRGTITAGANVLENESKTITAKAKAGYYLSDLQVDGKSVGAKSTYTIPAAQKNHTVKAVFSKQIKIMLDAGHAGYYNRSPVYSSYYESKMNWTLHNYLKTELEKYDGFQVGVTRKSQSKDLNVYYRGTAAKGYDLFLSLHSNATSSKSTDYPLIITQKGNTGDKLAKNLGKAIEDTMNTKQAYKVWQKLNSDGKTEYYGVLRGSKAVGTKGMIIEHSFHTNLAAAKWLSSNTNLKKMAQAEAKVIASYYGMSESSIGNNGSSGSSDSSGGAADTGTTTSKPAVSNVVSSSQKVKVIVSLLNMRKTYSTSSKSMGKAKKNKVYQLKAKTKDGKWGQIKENGYWIYLPGYTKVVTTSSGSTSSSVKTVKTSQKVKVNYQNLKVRKSPSTKGKVMARAKKGTVYQLKAKTSNGKWGQIKTNGYWIYLKRTKPVSSGSSVVKTSRRVKVKVSDLRMRKSYSTSSKSMGKVKKNKVYRLKARTKNNRWGQLKTNGYWIYLKKGYTKTV